MPSRRLPRVTFGTPSEQDLPDLPFPFSPVSNGEWCPPPPGPKQRAAAKLYVEEADRRARRLGLTRREFMRSAAGTATAFMVLNTIHGLPSGASEAVLPVTPEQCDDPEAARALFEKDFFVMDVQLHHIDLALCALIEPVFNCASLRFLGNASDKEKIALLSQTNFIKEVFIDSETAVGVISGVPDGIPLPVETMKQTRDLVNELAGSQRALVQAMIDPRTSGSTALSTMEHQVVDNGAAAVKCYTGNDSWWLDDRDDEVAYAMYQEATRLGLDVINIHKGLPLFGQDPAYLRTDDLDKATRDWPDLRFVVYHSGYFPGGEGISDFVSNIETMGRRNNLYTELGSTFATEALIGGPSGAARLIGDLLKALGSWRILWGTDSVWWGSPQWQIDMFKTLQIPESMQEKFGYPPLTDRMKARILGRNAARLYKIDIAEKRCEIENDELARTSHALGGRERSRTHFVYGPQTPQQFTALMDHAAGLRQHQKT